MGNFSKNGFTFPQSSGKHSLYLIEKSDHPCMKCNTGFIVALDVDETSLDVESYSLMLDW